ncbi:MAG: hypothetical protein L3J20_00560 [Flavobacteriaceae bacterium]|nr:hypothetical protein [Flavobacteriaceae bacterium]
MIKKIVLFISVTLFAISSIAQEETKNKATHDFELELEGEYRYFFKAPSFNNQKDHFPSIAVRPEYNVAWNDGYESITVKGFFRLDVDSERTHWDIRELYYQKAKDNWELSIGLKKIYWGVTESNHLVDIINQTDAVESFDGEQKLGQPMVQYSLNTDFGTFDLFYLPYFRKRTFPGEKSRLRFPIIITKNDIGFQSNAEEWRQDVAFRWSHSFSVFDIGLSHFYGTGREPIFNFNLNGNINAFYPVINQTGLDLQITHDAFLWKAESIYRTNIFQDMFAFTAGLEYTFSNIKSTGVDIGLIGEYLYDDRDELALNALQNDLFFGSRIAFNDVQSTEILLGGITDLKKSSKIFSIEASRRFGKSLKLEIEGRLFNTIDANEIILSNFKDDSFFRVTLFKYF